MKEVSPSHQGKPRRSSRRQFFAQSGKAAVASALAGAMTPAVHAAESNIIRLALIGCGNRGGGAVANAMNSANVADLMGRAAVHSGKLITWDEAMASNFQFCANIDAMDYHTPPPVLPDAQGRYPVPVPGVWSEM